MIVNGILTLKKKRGGEMKGRNGHLTFIASSKAFASLTVGSVNKDGSNCSFFISNNPINAGNKSCELQINYLSLHLCNF